MGSQVQWPAGSVALRSSGDGIAVGRTYPSQLFKLSEIFEEAHARCGLEFRESWQIVEGDRSLRLLFQEWSNRGINLWSIAREEIPLPAGTLSTGTPTDTIDVLNVFIRENTGTDEQMDYYLRRFSTDEWDRVPQKLQTQRPTNYWMDRAPRFPLIVTWPVPDVDYVLFYSRLRSLRSPTAGLTGDVDAPDRMIPALIAGLACLIAQKNKEAFPLIPGLKAEYNQQFQYAQMEDREKSDLQMVPLEVWP
jgi:hypothetical protein